jgi:RNA-directed DNA polymerase
VRYADDFLLTLERRADADRVATALAERLAKFGLRLHEDKTRLIDFGRFAATNRRRRSEGGQRRSTSWASRIIAE